MVPCRHFLAYMQVLEVTLLKLHFVDFVIPSHVIIPLLSNPVHYSLTELLISLSLPHHF